MMILSLATASFASVYDGKTETPASVQAEAPAAVETPAQEAAPVATPVATPVAAAPVAVRTPDQVPLAQKAPPPRGQVKTYSSIDNVAHNSFFFALNLGIRYMKLSYQEYEEYFDNDEDMWVVGDKGNSTRRRFKGLGPDVGLKFGGVIASRMALYCNLELTSLDGSYKASRTEQGVKKSRAEFDTDAVRFAIGGGTTVFLSNDVNSLFYGSFASITASIVVEEAGLTSSYYDHEELEISESGLAFALELGKLWRLSDSWNVGLVAKGSLDGAIRDGDSGNSSDCYTVGLSLIAVRK